MYVDLGAGREVLHGKVYILHGLSCRPRKVPTVPQEFYVLGKPRSRDVSRDTRVMCILEVKYLRYLMLAAAGGLTEGEAT